MSASRGSSSNDRLAETSANAAETEIVVSPGPAATPNQLPDASDDDMLDETLLAQIAYEEALAAGHKPAEVPGLDPAIAETIRTLHRAFGPPRTAILDSGDDGSLSSATANSKPKPKNDGGDDNIQAGSLPSPFGRYESPSLLGQGAFGSVWKAWDPLLKRFVAIKVLHPELRANAELSSRFVREARAAARLNHPNIVRVHEAGVAENISYLAAEFVEGRRLSEFCEAQQPNAPETLDSRQAAALIRQLADAVHHAHRQNVLHRDIKPENILLIEQDDTSDGSCYLARLTDFGLAQITDEASGPFSQIGLLVGTPEYMAPEQLTGRNDLVGAATDVYALGGVLYQLLCGRLPRRARQGTWEILSESYHVVPPRQVNASVPKDLDAICMRCLEVQPERRYTTAMGLRDDLTRFMDGQATIARPLSLYEQALRWCQTHRSATTALAAIAFVLITTIANLWTINRVAATKNQQLAEAWSTSLQSEAQAKNSEERFRHLAWVTGIQQAYSLMEQRQFLAADQAFQKLAVEHTDAPQRSEWQLATQELRAEFQVLAELSFPIREVVCIPGTNTIALAGDSPEVIVFDLAEQKILKSFTTEIAEIHALSASPNNAWLAVGGKPDTTDDLARPVLIDLRSGSQRQLPVAGPTTLESLSFGADSRSLAAGFRYEFVLGLRQYEDGWRQESTLPAPRRNRTLARPSRGNALVVQRDFEHLAVYGEDGGLVLISEPDQFEVFTVIPRSNWVVSSRFNAQGLAVHDLRNGSRLFELAEAPMRATAIAGSDDSNWVAAGYANGEALVWKIQQVPHGEVALDRIDVFDRGKLVDGAISSMCWAGDDLLVVSDDGRLVRWTPNATESTAFPYKQVTAICFSASSEELLIGLMNGSVQAIPVSDISFRGQRSSREAEPQGEVLCPPYAAAVSKLRIANEKDWMAIGYEDGSLRLQTLDGQLLHHFAHLPNDRADPATAQVNRRVNDIHFSLDDRWLAWGGADNQVIFQNTTDWNDRFPVRFPSDVEWLRFLGSSASVAVGGEFEGVRIVDTPRANNVEIVGHASILACEQLTEQGLLLLGQKDGSIQSMTINQIALTDFSLRGHATAVRSMDYLDATDIKLSIDGHGAIALHGILDETAWGRLRGSQKIGNWASHARLDISASPNEKFLAVLADLRRDEEIISIVRIYNLTAP